LYIVNSFFYKLIEHTENLATHRVQQIIAVLPTALVAGLAELDPEVEPLKVSALYSQMGGIGYDYA
jgi:hypothetical protein